MDLPYSVKINQIRIHLYPILAIFLTVTVLSVPDLFMYPGTDHGVYFNNGRLIVSGYVPYRDFFDHKTPLIYFYFAVWNMFLGSSWFSAKLSLIPIYSLFGCSLYLFACFVARSKKLSLLPALLGIYLVLRLGADPFRNGAIIVLASGFEMLSLALIYRFVTSPQKRAVPFISGILAGLAFLTRPTAIAPLVIFLFILVYRYIVSRQVRLSRSLFFLSGVAIPMAFALVPVVLGLIPWKDIYAAVIRFNLAYLRLGKAPQASLSRFFIPDAFFWLIGIPFVIFKKHKDRNLIFLLACFGVAFILALLSAKFQSFYRFQFLPYLLLLSLWGLYTYLKKAPRVLPVSLIGIPLLFLTLVFPDVVAYRTWYKTASYYQFDQTRFPDQLVSKEIIDLKPESIFVYGNRAWIYTFSGQVSPVKYYYSAPIFLRNYLGEREFAAFLVGLSNHPPEVVIVWPNRERPDNFSYNPGNIEEFYEFLAAEYTPYKHIDVKEAYPYNGGTVQILINNAFQ